MSSSPPPVDHRFVALSGAHNLRDLGGLATRSGGRVATGRVFRSDYPLFVDLDRQAVRRLGLRTVVDLRRGAEAAVESVDWAERQVSSVRWPLTAGHESSWHARYSAYLSHRPETVVGAVRAVLQPESHTVLFHCAAGKDRTGVVAALLLSVLGVAEEEIIADHLLSAASVAPVLARLRGSEVYAEMLRDSSVEDQLPQAEHMRSLLDWLSDRGGAEAWLVEHGVPAAEIGAFHRCMVGM